MPKYSIFATYYYHMYDVEADSEDDLYQLLHDGDISPMMESRYAPDVDFEVEDQAT